jgi:hypothetical protein
MALNFIKASGNIITEDFCNSLASETKAEYVKDKSFGESVKKIDEVIATTFEKLRERWEENRTSIINNTYDNSNLRQKWIIPFLKELGFDPIFVGSNIKSASGIEYQIPYKAWDSDFAPLILMVNSSQDLDDKDRTSRTHSNKSPQDCLQQFLNTSDHQWAILTNGKKVRIVRDFYHSITKGFLEFDLEGIFETANSEQFRVLYRVLHKSRFENQYQGNIEQEFDEEGNLIEKPDNCLLELYHKKAKETGIKVGNKLREQVINSIELLGNGFAEHLNPDDFQNGKVKAYYAEILNIIYRLLFLMFAEQKGWLPVRNSIYARTYSINSLKERAARGNYSHDEESDIWEGLKITFKLVTKGYKFKNGEKVNAFGGQLFSDRKISTIINLKIKNKFLLDAIYQLSFFKSENLINKINYANLAIDELGSVYESLLDFEPKLANESIKVGSRQINSGSFYLDDRGSDRKTSGSYYTDSRLVAQLVESTLVPVIENAIDSKNTQQEKEAALLELKVADLACGSGAFLCAASEKMGEYLAIIRMGDEDRPTDQQLREAKRDVLLHCIYGVDLNPMALELAKFSLWITASLPDMPLSFLDHKLKFGNSLIGAAPDLIKNGIPAEAYKEVENDNKETSKWLRDKVKKELVSLAKGSGVQSTLDLRVEVLNSTEDIHAYLEMLNNEQETPEEVEAAENEYVLIKKHLQHSVEWRLADAWTASFFIEKTDLQKLYPTNETLYNLRNGLPINETLINEIEQVRSQYHFFHYHLEFPEVFDNGGFDCILGNPPWEKIQPEQEQFFLSYYPEIALITDSTKRNDAIENLSVIDLTVYQLWSNYRNSVYRFSNYLITSGRFPLSAVGNRNLYRLFTDLALNVINSNGKVGYIVQSGIYADDMGKQFFEFLSINNFINSIFDFENTEKYFQIDSRMRYTLLTLGKNNKNPTIYGFLLRKIEDLLDPNKKFNLSYDEIKLINPNTKNCPQFKSRYEADLILKLYSNKFSKLLWLDDGFDNFKLDFTSEMINISRAPKKLFVDINESEMKSHIPVYEAKNINHFDHRFSTFTKNQSRKDIEQGTAIDASLIDKVSTKYEIQCRYYVPNEYYNSKNKLSYKNNWYIGIRGIASSTNERTLICSIVPRVAISYSINLILPEDPIIGILLCSNLNSFILDFITRSKVSNNNISLFIIKQLPVIDYSLLSDKVKIKIIDNTIKLSATSKSLEDLAALIPSHNLAIYNQNERFQLQCELDVIYAHLYGLNRKDMDYIMESFPIIKRKDINKYKSYRTKDTILNMYDEFSWVKDELNQTTQNN